MPATKRKKRHGVFPRGKTQKHQDISNRIINTTKNKTDDRNDEYWPDIDDNQSSSVNTPRDTEVNLVIVTAEVSDDEMTLNQLREKRRRNRQKSSCNQENKLRKQSKSNNNTSAIGDLATRLVPDPDAQPQTPLVNLLVVHDDRADIFSNPFVTMSDWRSFSRDVMNKACVPLGCWDVVMAKVEAYKLGRDTQGSYNAVLPQDHGA